MIVSYSLTTGPIVDGIVIEKSIIFRSTAPVRELGQLVGSRSW